MTQVLVLEKLGPNHIVINNYKKSNDTASFNKSKVLRESIVELAPRYEEYKADNCTTSANSQKDVKLLNEWIYKVRIITQARLAFCSLSKTHVIVL